MKISVRRLVPLLVLPLGLVACVLASAPWLRAFPGSVLAVPLVGTALLSVLLPVVVIAIGVRPLWITALIDVAGFVFFTMLVTLRDPSAISQLWDGLVHGPSQVLTFALPLVSPRTLLVPPIALCWLCGAIIGECLGRGWQSVVPYATSLVTFGLAYAATTRAITNSGDGRRYDTLLAGALLLTLLLLRAAQAWLGQDGDAEALQAEGVLPLRGLAVGATVSVVVALIAALVVQSAVFVGTPATAQRVPPVAESRALSPLSFVAGLRPEDPRAVGRRLFSVSFDRPASRYVALADVDTYDGDSWSFSREFRPSGGVIPTDPDPASRSNSPLVTQRYAIDQGELTTSPWMPFQYRPRDVAGTAVSIDPTSGMIVPSERLRAGQDYSVMSSTAGAPVESLPATALPGTSAPPSATALPADVRRSVGDVVRALQNETRTSGAPALLFLSALVRDFRKNYALSGTAGRTSSSPTQPTQPSTTSTRPTPTDSETPSRSVSPTDSAASRSDTTPPTVGGSSFAGVLASILGPRAATPEQYATLVALLARAQGVPSRVVTGFRVGSGSGATVPAGAYEVQSQQAWTWAEILVRGRGWVVADAAPSAYKQPAPAPSASRRQTPTPSPTSTPNALVTQAPSNSGNAVAPPSDTGGGRHPAPLLWVLLAVVVIVVLIVIPLSLVARKRLRRRRRSRAGDPRGRLVGAWQETLDVLTESGLPGLAPLTSAEVAAATERRFGTQPAGRVRAVGDAANAAIFSTAVLVGPEVAAAAWDDERELRHEVRRTLSFRHRLRAALRYGRAPRPGRRGPRRAR